MKFDDEFTADSSLNPQLGPRTGLAAVTLKTRLMLSSNVSVSGGDLNLEVTSSSGGIVSTNPDDGRTWSRWLSIYLYGYAESKIYYRRQAVKQPTGRPWWTTAKAGTKLRRRARWISWKDYGKGWHVFTSTTPRAPGDYATGNYSGSPHYLWGQLAAGRCCDLLL